MLLRILDSLADGITPKLIRFVIGILDKQHILVRLEPEGKATLFVHETIVHLLSLLRGVIERFLQVSI